MDRQELLIIVGKAMADAVEVHETQERQGLGPLERTGQLLPLLERTADEIEAWARRKPERR